MAGVHLVRIPLSRGTYLKDSRRRHVLVCVLPADMAKCVAYYRWVIPRKIRMERRYSTSEYRRVSMYVFFCFPALLLMSVYGELKWVSCQSQSTVEVILLHASKFYYTFCEYMRHSLCCLTSLIRSEIKKLSIDKGVHFPFLAANLKIFLTVQYPVMNVKTAHTSCRSSHFMDLEFFYGSMFGDSIAVGYDTAPLDSRVPSSHFAE